MSALPPSITHGGKIRFLGFVQMLCGGFITVLIGAVAALVGWIVVQPGKLAMHNNSRDQQQLFVIFGVLALVFAIGLTFASAGIWQIIFARRNKFLMWTALILIIVVFGGAEIFVAVLEQ